MPDYNARAYDLLSVGTSISLNLVCLLARWGQGDSLVSYLDLWKRIIIIIVASFPECIVISYLATHVQ